MIYRIIFSLLVCFSSASIVALAAKPIQLADDAPDSYTVKRGDTLWAISGKFLKEPWRWPEVWRLNREQIHNPHLIYPGQVVLLDRNGPKLSIGRPLGPAKLQPQVYEDTVSQAIPSIPTADIMPFLSQPLIVDDATLNGSAKIIATQESRVMVGAGDVVYATGVKDEAQGWQLYRPAKPINDPITKELLGYEAIYLGSANLTRPGEPATLSVTAAQQEIGRGDRLVPASKPDVLAYSPHAPDKEITGQIIGLYNSVGTGETGRNYIVTINRGTREGLEVGHVLAIYRTGSEVTYREGSAPKEIYTLPEERYGLLFVFRTFERMSYALVMNSSRPVAPLDIIKTP